MVKILFAACLFLTSASAFAAASEDSTVDSILKPDGPKMGQEFIYRASPNDTIIAVQLLGSVQKPGIYHIPATTDLIKVLALAGGPNTDANTEEITVRRKNSVDKINLDALLGKSTDYRYGIKHDDVIFVPQKQAWFSNNATRTLTVVSVGLGIVLTTLLISANANRK